jgi:hypothetical protein
MISGSGKEAATLSLAHIQGQVIRPAKRLIEVNCFLITLIPLAQLILILTPSLEVRSIEHIRGYFILSHRLVIYIRISFIFVLL